MGSRIGQLRARLAFALQTEKDKRFHGSSHESFKILGLSLTQAISTDSIFKPAHNDQSHFPHAGISLIPVPTSLDSFALQP